MTKVYEAKVLYYEGKPTSLGVFDSRDKADKAIEEDKEETGFSESDNSSCPNIEFYVVHEMEVR